MSAPSFETLRDAVEFLAGNLENQEYDRINDRCSASLSNGDRSVQGSLPSPRAYRLTAIRALGERHAQRDLRLLYEGREFPADRQEFKLGGHDKELGHIHLDFDRTAAGWCLKDILICR